MDNTEGKVTLMPKNWIANKELSFIFRMEVLNKSCKGTAQILVSL